jgi:exopolysaccharide production repressor protein
MSLPVFLRGLILLLCAFAVATYLITGSVWSTLIDTVICAVLVQAGYFAVVLYLVWRTPSRARPERDAGLREAEQNPAADENAAQVGALRRTPPSNQS